MDRLPLGVQESGGANVRASSGIAGAISRNMRGQQRVESQAPPQRLIAHLDFGVHEQDRTVWVGQHLLYQTVAAVPLGICKAVENAIALRVFDQVVQVPLLLVAKSCAVRYEKLQVARVRLIDMRIVDLIDDPVTEGKP